MRAHIITGFALCQTGLVHSSWLLLESSIYELRATN